MSVYVSAAEAAWWTQRKQCSRSSVLPSRTPLTTETEGRLADNLWVILSNWWPALLHQRCDGARSATKHPSTRASRPTRPPAAFRCRLWVRPQQRAAVAGKVRRRGRRRSVGPSTAAAGRQAASRRFMHQRAPSCSMRISGRAVSTLMNRISDLSHSNLSSEFLTFDYHVLCCYNNQS